MERLLLSFIQIIIVPEKLGVPYMRRTFLILKLQSKCWHASKE